MRAFKPFADNRASRAIAGLTVENGTDKVSLYGSLAITRDEAGLERALALKAVVDATVTALQAGDGPPEKAAPPRPTRTVKNPFA